MARTQTRRNVSLQGAIYARLEAWCAANKRAKSSVLEELLADLPPVASAREESKEP